MRRSRLRGLRERGYVGLPHGRRLGIPRDGRVALGRVLTAAALVAAVAAVAVTILGSGREYRVNVLLENASQLVEGNLVKVGGREVGEIAEIRLADDNQARLEVDVTDEDLAPLHQGTRAVVRVTSLAGVANRYVALLPGPNSAPEIPEDGTIAADDTQSAVDLDALLNTLDAETRAGAGSLVRSLARASTGAEREINAGLRALVPALGQTDATVRELLRDQRLLETFLVESAAVVSALASRREDLESGIVDAAAVTGAVARERAALGEAIERAPAVLRSARATFADLRGTLAEVRPTLRLARPVAPRLADVLVALRPVARRARPVVADLRALLPGVATVLRQMPRLEASAVPAFRSATRALDEASGVVTGLRPYVPDVVAGLLNGFGGSTTGYYDANGHYVRISFQGGPYSLNNAGSLVPVPPSDGSLAGFKSGVTNRCPGAAAPPGTDGSNPWLAPEAPCDPAQVLP